MPSQTSTNLKTLIIPLMILSALSIFASALMSYIGHTRLPSNATARLEAPGKPPEWVIRQMPTIVTNLIEPQNVWIRLDLHVRVASKSMSIFEDRRALIADDILAYLRSTAIEELEGGLGLLALRSEILDRFHFRMGNDISNIMITTFVVQ